MHVPPQEGDDTLIGRYRDQGDVAALDALARRHAGLLQGYLRGILGNEAEADDAFQETWIRVIRSPRGFKGGNFRGWLLRIAHNVAMDHFRGRRPNVSIDAEASTGGSLLDFLPADTLDPAQLLGQADALEMVAGKVRSLPEPQRQVFLMRVAGDLSFAEIAKTLGIPLNTALGRMHYAVTKLRKYLKID